MLFLTRNKGEVIVLTDKISGETVCKILVDRIDLTTVSLGLDAPKTIQIDRDFYHGPRKNGDQQNGNGKSR